MPLAHTIVMRLPLPFSSARSRSRFFRAPVVRRDEKPQGARGSEEKGVTQVGLSGLASPALASPALGSAGVFPSGLPPLAGARGVGW